MKAGPVLVVLAAAYDSRSQRLELTLRIFGDRRQPWIRDIRRLGEGLEDLTRELEGRLERLAEDPGNRIRIAALGLDYGERLLPSAIRSRLAELGNLDPGAPATELLIVSDLPRVAWEMMYLDFPGRGGFVGHLFAVTRWIHDRPAPLYLPLERLGMVAGGTEEPPQAGRERRLLRELFAAQGRSARETPAEPVRLIEAMLDRAFDAYHFGQHGDEDLDGSVSLAFDESSWLETDMKAPGMAPQEVFVFLNSCHSGKVRRRLPGLGGLGRSFLEAGAHAVIDGLWRLEDESSVVFSLELYRQLLAGSRLGEASRLARLAVERQGASWSTGLAYAVYGHPAAAIGGAGHAPRIPRPERHFQSAEAGWDPRFSPNAVLKADLGIVDFHLRDREMADLQSWCRGPGNCLVRLITGPGGMGKTRLAHELCRILAGEGWRAGLVTDAACLAPDTSIEEILEPDGPLLLVVDYAESRTPFLARLLREMVRRGARPYRVLLLSRRRYTWWERLQAEGPPELLQSQTAVSIYPLKALAARLPERQETFRLAYRCFADFLQIPGESPGRNRSPNLSGREFELVLLLHIHALASVQGGTGEGREQILDGCLMREQDHWRRQLRSAGLTEELAEGIAVLVAAIYRCGGAADPETARRWLGQVGVLADQPRLVQEQILRILATTYPGAEFIARLQPDLVGEHLVMKVNRTHRKELEAIAAAGAGINPPGEAE